MAQWLDEFDQLIWLDQMDLPAPQAEMVRQFESTHGKRPYYSACLLEQHIDARLEDMRRRRAHLRRILNRLDGETEAASILREFEAHARQIEHRYDFALYVLRNRFV